MAQVRIRPISVEVDDEGVATGVVVFESIAEAAHFGARLGQGMTLDLPEDRPTAPAVIPVSVQGRKR